MAEKTVNNDFYKLSPQPLQVGERKIQLTYDPDNGNTKLYEIVTVGGVQTAKVAIYENGVWNNNGLGVISDPKERITVHENVTNSITKARGTSGTGVLPGFIKNKAGSQDTQIGGGTSPTGPQGIIQQVSAILGAITNPIPSLTPFNVSGSAFANTNEKALFNDTKLLTYPIDMITSEQDRLEISQYRYQPTGAESIFTNPTSVIQNNIQRNTALSELIGLAILPIPNGISDSNNVSWGSDQMNAMTAGATGTALNKMSEHLGAGIVGGTAAGIGQLLTKGQSPLGILQAAKGGAALSIYKDVVGAAVGSPKSLGAFSAAFSSQILKMAQYEVSPESILARGFGIVPNSNLELLFNSPELRQFTFAYRLSPRSTKEARNVKRIIRFFKQGMSPRKQTGQAGQSSFFLGTPNVFKLRYKTGKNNPISGLNKFKVCALTNFSVNYAPEGTWAAYDEGQPVSVTITMQFAELEPIYNTDYQTSIFSTRSGDLGDLDQVQNDDVGY